ncbi:MAG: hypothetical protein M1829_003225 [Trizodia sp. TS-e1964]|nr:MAG: hypothetical protein M1829_003225 [Trizodia sp. TS-e1964]
MLLPFLFPLILPSLTGLTSALSLPTQTQEKHSSAPGAGAQMDIIQVLCSGRILLSLQTGTRTAAAGVVPCAGQKGEPRSGAGCADFLVGTDSYGGMSKPALMLVFSPLRIARGVQPSVCGGGAGGRHVGTTVLRAPGGPGVWV